MAKLLKSRREPYKSKVGCRYGHCVIEKTYLRDEHPIVYVVLHRLVRHSYTHEHKGDFLQLEAYPKVKQART